MRPNLLHPRAERRHARRRRRDRGGPAARAGNAAGETSARPLDGTAQDTRTSGPVGGHAYEDAAVERVREAGGPIDRASYTCQCGYVFSASVSTTVACPHCGLAQAW
ncbi:MAG TPA: hypothetical protein VK272_00480 [Solirubrobacteraceae bacterium]|nr:hypothetical protein [Solirubrobacteraceae bacterium]